MRLKFQDTGIINGLKVDYPVEVNQCSHLRDKGGDGGCFSFWLPFLATKMTVNLPFLIKSFTRLFVSPVGLR